MSQLPLQLIPERKIYSVAEISASIKGLLESQYPDVWVAGEISNFRPAGSGHLYFTLKDAAAQLRAVCFRNQARYLKFKPSDGLAVIARGRLSAYEARGEYQMVVDFLEPAGAGALHAAFEQLRKKLAAEGLFDQARKKPLPLLPRAVGVVTSSQGAAVRDILRVLHRRFPNMDVSLYPVKVQGEGAAQEIRDGIAYFNEHALADVLIVGRGGGSLEDLWAFNEEVVARAIADSRVPIVSAVGHETDFTIADFVADLRAPTPSAAAEMVVHPKSEFIEELGNRARHMAQALRLLLAETRERLTRLRQHRAFHTLPARVAERAQRVDDAVASMGRAVERGLHRRRQTLTASTSKLVRFEPRRLLDLRAAQVREQQSRLARTIAELARRVIEREGDCRRKWLETSAGVARFDFGRFLALKRTFLAERHDRVGEAYRKCLSERRTRVQQFSSLVEERNPLRLMERGYSVTRDATGRIVRDAGRIGAGEEISVRLARGELGAVVRRITRE